MQRDMPTFLPLEKSFISKRGTHIKMVCQFYLHPCGNSEVTGDFSQQIQSNCLKNQYSERTPSYRRNENTQKILPSEAEYYKSYRLMQLQEVAETKGENLAMLPRTTRQPPRLHPRELGFILCRNRMKRLRRF